jgi:glycosyltransferase involved in cell wall biosynthesis
MVVKGLVSVIIPIRRGEDIVKVVKSVENSTYTNIEIIIVDEGLERSTQRNIGIGKARGEYLLILDSDQRISYGLIAECVRLMAFGYGAIYIPEIIKTKGVFAYIRNWERQFYNATDIDVVRFVRSEFCPLFDTDLNGPEDSAWDRKVTGFRTTSCNPLYHYDNIGMFKYFSKKAYYSKSMRRYAKKYPNDKCLDWKWRCLGVFFERGGWKRVLKRPDLFICVMLIILIRGIIYYAKR